MIALAALLVFESPELITITPGNMPLIITAPHGGVEDIPDCPPRKGVGAKQFVTVKDTNTDILADLLAQEVEGLTGKKPWVIVAHFARTHADVNRTLADGTECKAAEVIHKKYHQAISEAIKTMRKDKDALLLDIHAQKASSDTIFRGTNNGVTCSFTDPSSLPHKFFDSLKASGIKVFPDIDRLTDKEDDRYTGGYTVNAHGRKYEEGINAIQLEFGADYRSQKSMQQTARTIAEAYAKSLSKPSQRTDSPRHER
jgi:N-formylglutamate amidohydrolase